MSEGKIGNWELGIDNLSTLNPSTSLKQAINCQLSTINHQLSTINYQL
ncbi:MAG: hypothetical protein HC849_17875 [Oscillatoriales cyanobacterium RU_3_3]|nr:hypothetical protein [Microcoleus sp. SM1_3_4]NJM61637.1 hypothetical protein [Oscillatoriales cyanobacterium RU_3_3]